MLRMTPEEVLEQAKASVRFARNLVGGNLRLLLVEPMRPLVGVGDLRAEEGLGRDLFHGGGPDDEVVAVDEPPDAGADHPRARRGRHRRSSPRRLRHYFSRLSSKP